MLQVTVAEAKPQLSSLRRGKPIAELVPRIHSRSPEELPIRAGVTR